MYYRGFKIEAQYLPGDDFRILKDGRVVDKHPTKVDFYQITETSTGWRHANAGSFTEAKQFINELLEKMEKLYASV